MDLASTIDKYLSLVEEVLSNKIDNVYRDISSRLENPINYVRETEPSSPVFEGNKIIHEVNDGTLCRRDREWVILGVDGSSRAVDTPYMFLGLATVSIYSRILGEILDHPPLPAKYLLPPMDIPFIAISPDFPLNKVIPDVFLKSPAGVPYDRDYNKALILDELRFTLENTALLHIAQNTNLIRSILRQERILVFVDGPVYPVPNLFRQHYNLVTKNLPSRGRLDDYVASWKELLKYRLTAIKALEEQGVPVIGIVKRIESSRLLLSTNNFIELVKQQKLWVGDLGNDQAFIDSILRLMLIRKNIAQPYRVMYIGPIIVPAEATYLNHYLENVSDKIVYYVLIPLNKYGSEKIMYTLFRVEVTKNSYRLLGEDPLSVLAPVFEDSILSGTTLPVSILYADKRSKTLSRSLANIIARDLERRGVPLTYDTIRTIEAYSIGG